jgi:nucleoside-diphosphate-sugar epimerase
MDNSHKVLVTGATGLVGVHLLVDLIDRGFEHLVGLYRSDSALNKAKQVAAYYDVKDQFELVEWIKFDLSTSDWDEKIFETVDVLIHTAAMVSFDPEENDKMREVNVAATAKLLAAAKRSGIGKFGFISSIAALGRQPGENIYTEENEWRDSDLNSYYSVTKHDAEVLVIEANNSRMSTYLINPGVILGPCDWDKSSGTIFRSARNGLSFYTVGGNGFVDARDVSNNLLQIMVYGDPGERYLAVGHNVKFKKIFTDVQLAFGKNAPRFRAAKWLTNLGWKIEQWRAKRGNRPPVLTKHSADASHEVSVYKNEKIHRVKGVSFRTWEDTVQNTVTYFKTYNKK